MQHCLNFLPERQGQGLFRPTFGIAGGFGDAAVAACPGVLQNEANCSVSAVFSESWVFMMASRAWSTWAFWADAARS